MTLHLEHGTIDPNYRLAHGDAEDMIGDAQPTAQQIEAINEAIEALAQEDPDGSSDYQADRLRRRVAEILESRAKPIYLEADTTNGITTMSEEEAMPGMEFLDPEDFAERLPTLPDDKVIFTIISGEDHPIYQKLVTDYGIH